LDFCPLGAPELGETLFSPPLYRQRYQAVLTYLAEEQQNVGTIQVTPPPPFISVVENRDIFVRIWIRI
jgi:hypothetical protein